MHMVKYVQFIVDLSQLLKEKAIEKTARRV